MSELEDLIEDVVFDKFVKDYSWARLIEKVEDGFVESFYGKMRIMGEKGSSVFYEILKENDKYLVAIKKEDIYIPVVKHDCLNGKLLSTSGFIMKYNCNKDKSSVYGFVMNENVKNGLKEMLDDIKSSGVEENYERQRTM